MAKIRKKVQAIADNLQKGEKGKVPSVSPAAPASPQVHSVSPLPKNQPGGPKPSGKTHKKKKREGVAYVKEGPVREPEEKKERLTGYARLARRVAGRIVGEIRGAKFWFDDD